MISPDHARLMARYNEWQNRSLYDAGDTLTDDARRRDRGAFFGSIHGTLNHLLWADEMWMSRFAGTPKPEGAGKDSPTRIAAWETLKDRRRSFDRTILDWTQSIDQSWLAQDLTWFSGLANAERTKPRWLAVTHFFNHQTHHRGQVHAMLTAAGAKPDDTDLIILGV